MAVNKGGRPLKYPTVAALEAAIDDYFDDCEVSGAAPTWASMLLALKLSDDTLLRYRSNEGDKYEGYADCVKRAERRHCDFWQQFAITHPNLQSFCIFELKQPHNGGFADKQQVDTSAAVKIEFAISGQGGSGSASGASGVGGVVSGGSDAGGSASGSSGVGAVSGSFGVGVAEGDDTNTNK